MPHDLKNHTQKPKTSFQEKLFQVVRVENINSEF